jgi:uncharacterized membrane protein YcjF (UPF0283 family)
VAASAAATDQIDPWSSVRLDLKIRLASGVMAGQVPTFGCCELEICRGLPFIAVERPVHRYYFANFESHCGKSVQSVFTDRMHGCPAFRSDQTGP